MKTKTILSAIRELAGDNITDPKQQAEAVACISLLCGLAKAPLNGSKEPDLPKRKTKSGYRAQRWTKENDLYLFEHWDDRIPAIGRALNRTTPAIYARRTALKESGAYAAHTLP